MSQIKMGNDEFILYVRKQRPMCETPNDRLGLLIWQWIGAHDQKAEKIQEDQPCMWEHCGPSIDARKLPKTATQFRFERALLPRLYDYLDTL